MDPRPIRCSVLAMPLVEANGRCSRRSTVTREQQGRVRTAVLRCPFVVASTLLVSLRMLGDRLTSFLFLAHSALRFYMRLLL